MELNLQAMKKRNFILCNFRKPSKILLNIINSLKLAKFDLCNKIMPKEIYLIILLIYLIRNVEKVHIGLRNRSIFINSDNASTLVQLELMT